MSRIAGMQPLRTLFYITHKDNLPSILEHGILSHNELMKRGLPSARVYDEEIVAARGEKKVPRDGRSLWDFANLYFQPRNPMMYRVVDELGAENLAVVGIKKSVLDLAACITDGNAANNPTKFYPVSDFKKNEMGLMRDIDRVWWRQDDGSKRRIMSECLVPAVVPPEYIEEIFAPTYEVADELRDRFKDPDVHVICEPNIFFQPTRVFPITANLSVVQGDMFFSRMQTLTVSVNCVGVMGKGVASRARYQFPDVYVYYEDACRNGRLRLGKPVLYKREVSFEQDAADQPQTMSMSNSVGETWFLLFPTKNHWRDKSNIPSIEEGLIWLKKSYKVLGIKSLALPALGCGLGGLDWKDVGPLLCKYLSMDIPVQIYLPTEKKVPEKFLEKAYLLPGAL